MNGRDRRLALLLFCIGILLLLINSPFDKAHSLLHQTVQGNDKISYYSLSVKNKEANDAELMAEKLKPSDPQAPAKVTSLLLNGILVGNLLIPETVLVPAGSFHMGQPNPNIECHGCSRDEQPVHTVDISEFEMGRTEVTNAQYKLFADETGRATAEWRQYFTTGRDNHPVINVSWSDAQAYCAWLQAATGKEYRLPTEAEWEYAARANSNKLYTGKDSLYPSDANFHSRTADHVGTTKVGKFKPNSFGLYDMLGNAWEWCSDWYLEDYYKDSPIKDPQGPTSGNFHILRGGSWLSNKDLCRVANRSWHNTGFIMDGRGFRVAVSIEHANGEHK